MKPTKELKKLCQEVHLDDLVRQIKLVLHRQEGVYAVMVGEHRVYAGDIPSHCRRKAIQILTELCKGSPAVRQELPVAAPIQQPVLVPPIAPQLYPKADEAAAPAP